MERRTMKSFGENRLTKDRASDWEGRSKISKKVRDAFWKQFKKESKTIKVGEDAVGKAPNEIHYALVVDNEVIKTGSKEDMLKLHGETKGSRVWVTSSKEGAIVEEAPMNSTGPSISMPPTMKKKKKKDEGLRKRWESYGNKHDNGVHEMGTDEIRKAYQEDTPGQDMDEYIEVQTKFFQEQKNKVQKHFSQVFGNPLKGYPYNEDIEVK